ncbi:MAG: hypothetical protein Q7U35_08405 [Methanobacteriaceae archaeon]|nr:hypothetical protein [Methanobacteriaceae archaeon]MDP2836161.1 hypothetical protein [Methanobacteriaceae archaeon]MDP3035463.1 hypothetical protein [Methanobacteriaceae archaeon]MDP3486001.1 hypothetical protein [Methanobacteriaceae archaeon]MDP3622978.1 hypothetical protein [Methanobacteriaceae archaeon]
MYEIKIQNKITEAQIIIDGFLDILRENNSEMGLKICQEKELTMYYKKMSSIIKYMARMDPLWEFRIAHPRIIVALTNYRSAIM